MAYAPATQITSWSYSRYASYKLCPFQAKCKFILKLPEPGNAAMDRGNAIHKLAEDYINGKIRNIPAELKQFENLFKTLKAERKKKTAVMFVEDSWAYRKDWSQTVFNDWANCWLRVKLDCAHTENVTRLIVNDWKTGKLRPEEVEAYVEQLELYALAAMTRYPHIEEVVPRLVYLDEGKMYPQDHEQLIYTRKDMAGLLKTWEKRIKPMLTDKKFLPKPNNKCKWCHYRKDNGGPCKF